MRFASGIRGLAVAAVMAACTTASADERLPRENLLVYRTADKTVAPVKTPADWARRRAEVIAAFESVAGRFPGADRKVPLDMKVISETDRGTYVLQLIEYSSEANGRVPAYLTIPKGLRESGKKVPAVLCLHGTNNVIGHGTVYGLGQGPDRSYGSALAEMGYVTLAPSYPLLANYQPDLKALGWESGTMKAIWDNSRGLDLLDSLPYVQSGKYATIGHSLGGHNSVYTALFDDRLKAVITSCGLDSYLDYYGGVESVWFPEKGWCQTRYMPKLANYRGRLADIPFDFHELIGSLAPRAVFIAAPLKDSNFKHDSVDRVVAAAKPVYALLGAPDALTVEHPDCEHDFPAEMKEIAYKLIEKTIGSPEPK